MAEMPKGVSPGRRFEPPSRRPHSWKLLWDANFRCRLPTFLPLVIGALAAFTC